MITENDDRLDMAPALELAALLRIPTAQQDAFLATCRSVIGRWRDHAGALGLTKVACDRMAPCFQVP